MIIIFYADFIGLKEKCDEIIKKGWIECSNHNTGNAGLLLERLLGLENHNFCFPDYNGIEIKTKFINSISRMTLFNATPDGCLFSAKRLYENYGYPDHNNKNFKAFHFSFGTNRKTYLNNDIYGKLYIDRKNRKIVLKLYDTNNKLIDEETSWSFDLLEERLSIKLNYLLIMYVKKTKFQNKYYCKYLYYTFFYFLGFEEFLNSIEKGHIKIAFSINTFRTGKRAGKIHDHGTSFVIDINHIENLFCPINLDVRNH